jgi:hypothetical protein
MLLTAMSHAWSGINPRMKMPIAGGTTSVRRSGSAFETFKYAMLTVRTHTTVQLPENGNSLAPEVVGKNGETKARGHRRGGATTVEAQCTRDGKRGDASDDGMQPGNAAARQWPPGPFLSVDLLIDQVV